MVLAWEGVAKCKEALEARVLCILGFVHRASLFGAPPPSRAASEAPPPPPGGHPPTCACKPLGRLCTFRSDRGVIEP